MQADAITAFDALILLLAFLAVIYGLVKGFTNILVRVLAFAGALLITLYAGGLVSGLARTVIEPAPLADIIALPALFLVSLFLLFLLGDLLGDKVRSSSVGLLDRSLGAMVSLVMVAGLVSGVYLALSEIIPQKRHPDWIKQARLQPIVNFGAEMLGELSPWVKDRAEELNEESAELIDSMKQNIPSVVDRAGAAREPAYDELQRRLLDDAVRRLNRDQPDDGQEDRENR